MEKFTDAESVISHSTVGRIEFDDDVIVVNGDEWSFAADIANNSVSCSRGQRCVKFMVDTPDSMECIPFETLRAMAAQLLLDTVYGLTGTDSSSVDESDIASESEIDSVLDSECDDIADVSDSECDTGHILAAVSVDESDESDASDDSDFEVEPEY